MGEVRSSRAVTSVLSCCCRLVWLHPAMPFACLHTIELQLIMQLCDKAALFALARCSKATLAGASSEFAFRCLSPMPLNPTSALHPNTPTGLLRFCDVSLTSVKASRLNPPVCAAFCVPRVPTFVSLNELSLAVMESLLCSPSMARLQCLSLPTISEPMLALAAERLTNLRTLRLSDGLPGGAYPHLPSLSQLTELSLSYPAALQFIVDCPQLRSLTLPFVASAEIVVSLLSPSDFARRLESLDLRYCDFKGIGDADKCAAVFASCMHLSTLTLHDCNNVTPVLLAVSRCCPRLKSVNVIPDKHWWRLLWNRGIDHPSAGAIPLPSQIRRLLDARRNRWPDRPSSCL